MGGWVFFGFLSVAVMESWARMSAGQLVAGGHAGLWMRGAETWACVAVCGWGVRRCLRERMRAERLVAGERAGVQGAGQCSSMRLCIEWLWWCLGGD